MKDSYFSFYSRARSLARSLFLSLLLFSFFFLSRNECYNNEQYSENLNVFMCAQVRVFV